jgi:hypothetical protein
LTCISTHQLENEQRLLDSWPELSRCRPCRILCGDNLHPSNSQAKQLGNLCVCEERGTESQELQVVNPATMLMAESQLRISIGRVLLCLYISPDASLTAIIRCIKMHETQPTNLFIHVHTSGAASSRAPPYAFHSKSWTTRSRLPLSLSPHG